MLETSTLPRVPCWALAALLAAGCATHAPEVVQAPAPAVDAPDPRVLEAERKSKLAEEARALLAQAETDVQRARAKRALWQKAWEDLLESRRAVAAGDSAGAIEHARRASELAQLGLEQLAYPAVK